jgi:hypothetical protein
MGARTKLQTQTRPTSIESILNKLTGVKPTGQNKWTAYCPVPGHKTPAKHLSVEDTGTKALVSCFPSGGHTYADICRALGFETLSYGTPQISARDHLHAVLIITYDYQDQDGTLLYQVCRYLPKTFKVRRPDGAGGWIWGLGDVKPVLYHLPELITAKINHNVIYVCEGEKDSDSAFLHFGTPGTCNPFGAGKWKSEYSETLRGCNIVVIPDNDAPGQTHGTQVCASLYGKAKSLKIWHVPAPHKDLTEWLEEQNDGRI